MDDTTPIDGLLQLADKHPNIELGILLSPFCMGTKRYPSKQYIEKLCQHSHRLPLSAHICREWMKKLFAKDVEVYDFLKTVWPHFKRIQFNYYNFFSNHDIYPKGVAAKAKALLEVCQQPCFEGKELIFPYSEHSKEFIEDYLLPVTDDYRPTIFFDGSHGQGRAPDSWHPPFPGLHHGYAGGLGPDNIERHMDIIMPMIPPDAQVSFDAETNLMSPVDGHFDILRGDSFATKINEWVAKN